MKLFWLILSAVDAGFSFEGFMTSRWGWGLYFGVLAAWAMLLATNTKGKTDDEAR